MSHDLQGGRAPVPISDQLIKQVAADHGTPFYIYDWADMDARFIRLGTVFGDMFGVSYAVKANPNRHLLREILPHVATFDVSSYKEVERALDVGCPPERITFSGPAKREAEIRGAVEQGIGELVVESVAEADIADQASRRRGTRQKILVRINPASGPKHFGVSFSGRASQFGIDEEDLEPALAEINSRGSLELVGFHIYSGTNSLNADAIIENIVGFLRIFRTASDLADIKPAKLVFGSGFGLPYGATDRPLDIEAVAAGVRPEMAAFREEARFRESECVLEMGRWLVGPGGYLASSVVGEKLSRGVAIRTCDAGFNNHLAAFGMMGTVIKRNWRIRNISGRASAEEKYMLVGPLCTSIDVLATDILLPQTRRGDIVVVENSGAYGLSASPTRFISHPEPKEYMLKDGIVTDITETSDNQWADIDRTGTPLRESPRLGVLNFA